MDWFLYDNGPRHERVKLYPWLDYDEITDCVTYFFHHWKLGDNVEKSLHQQVIEIKNTFFQKQ